MNEPPPVRPIAGKVLPIVVALLLLVPPVVGVPDNAQGAASAEDQEPRVQRGEGLETTFRSGVNMAMLTVSVIDRNGVPIHDLGTNDFRVREDAELRNVGVVLSGADAPLQLALLVDLSNSIRDKDWQTPTIALLDGLAPHDCVLLLGFSFDQPGGAWAPGKDSLLRETINNAELGPGTPFYDALIAAAELIGRAPGDGDLSERLAAYGVVDHRAACTASLYTRRAVIVITDGKDVGSSHTLEDAIVLTQRAGVPVFPVYVGRALRAPPEPVRPQEPGGRGRGRPRVITPLQELPSVRALRKVAAATGGRLTTDEGSEGLLESLRETYLLGYYFSPPDPEAYLGVYRRELSVEVPDLVGEVQHSAFVYRVDSNRQRALADVEHATALLDRGRFEDALLSLDAAIDADPWFSTAHLQRAVALEKLERYMEACRSAVEAAQLQPGSRDHHRAAAAACFRAGDTRQGWEETVRAVHAGARVEEVLPDGADPLLMPDELRRRLEAPRMRVIIDGREPSNDLSRIIVERVAALARLAVAYSGVCALVDEGDQSDFTLRIEIRDVGLEPISFNATVDSLDRRGRRILRERLRLENPSRRYVREWFSDYLSAVGGRIDHSAGDR